MIDLDRPLPDLPRARRDADIVRLRALMTEPAEQRSRRVPRWALVGGVGLGIAAGGAATAAVVLAPTTPTETTTARCYWEASTDTSDGFPGATVIASVASDEAGPATIVEELLEVCAMEWRMGFFQIDSPGLHQDPETGPYPVPPLVACVLPSGEAAVFPGTASTCHDLGFAPMAPSGTQN